MKLTQKRLAKLFNEWLSRWQKTPEAFVELKDASGDYGKDCVGYLKQLDAETPK